MRGPATTIIRSAGTRRRASGKAAITRRSRSSADARPADGDDAHLLVGRGSRARRAAASRSAKSAGSKPGDVAGEVEVLLRPVADQRQVRPERVGDDVVGVADEDRAVAHAREARDVLDHLGVVVGGRRTPRARRRRASGASRRSRSATRTRRASARGSRAGSSRAPTPRRRSRGRTGSSRTTSWKTMKLATRISSMRRHRLEAVQVVLGGLGSRCASTRSRGSALAGWMRSPSASSTAVTGCWASQSISRSGMERAQLARDRHVAPRMAEPDRRRDVERALAPRRRTRVQRRPAAPTERSTRRTRAAAC